jgi:hypothetical protein
VNAFPFLLSGLVILMQALPAAAGEAPPTVSNGDTVESILQKLGKPKGVVSGGARTTYYYEQGTVDFVTGRVVNAMLVSSEEARERTARRELEEKNFLKQRDAERRRLTEAGAAALARTVADKSFAALPASERAEFWVQFAKQYPSTDISAQVAQTAEAVKTDQKERDRTDELVRLNQRVGAIQERFTELDADYAASLANWKRAEIDAERAKLKDELSTIATRVHELSATP